MKKRQNVILCVWKLFGNYQIDTIIFTWEIRPLKKKNFIGDVYVAVAFRGLKGATPVHNLAKNGSKSLPCRETVAVARCPKGGGTRLDFGGGISCWGWSCRRNHVAENFQRGHCKNAFFKIDSMTIGGHGIEKSFQMEKVCLPVRRAYMGVVHVCKHPFQTVNGAVHHALKGLCSIRQPKRHEQILKLAKWHDNCRFWDVCNCNRDLVITLDKINFF